MVSVMKVPISPPRRGQGLHKCKHRADKGAYYAAHKKNHRVLKYFVNLITAPAAAVTSYGAQIFTNIRAAIPSTTTSPNKNTENLIEGGVTKKSSFDIQFSNKQVDSLASDVSNPLAVADYVEDMYRFYTYYEKFDQPLDYIQYQVEISERMRASIVDFIIAVHQNFTLRPETLYLTISIIDRHLSLERVQENKLEVIGMSALHLSCKYEEILAPEVDKFMYTTDAAYTRQEMLVTENEILNNLHWRLTIPTQYVFIMRFLHIAMFDKEMEHTVFFLSELGLMQYSMIKYPPSLAAASAVYAARWTLKKSPHWTETLECQTGFSETQLWNCAQILVKCHSDAPRSKLKAVFNKYSNVHFGAVALHEAALELLQNQHDKY